MKVDPKRLDQAMAAIYGHTTPRRISPLLFVPCPTCKGQPREMTVCPTCRGHLRVEKLG